MVTLNEILQKTIQFFKAKNFDSPRLDAELIIAHALKIPRIQLYVKHDSPLSESEVSVCRDVVRRRTQGEPVAYIIEEKGFYGLTFKVEKGVLIPRPETEMIVDEVLKVFAQNKKNTEYLESPKRILDLGAGTGCIGLSILKNTLNTQLVAIEKSPVPHNLIMHNLEKLELHNRVQVICDDIQKINFNDLGQFDFIVSNPPYIKQNDPEVEKDVHQFEPHEALYADEEGLFYIKQWMTKSIPILKPNGLIFFEMGYQQRQAVESFLKDTPGIRSFEILKDLSGLDRIIKAST